MPKTLRTLTGLLLSSLAASPVSGQGRDWGLRFEAGAAVVVSARTLGEGQLRRPLRSATLITGGMVLRSGSSLAFRARAGTGLTAGRALIRPGSAANKSGTSQGRALLALGEVLLSLKDKPNAELAVGIGARRYHFGQDRCEGSCSRDPSNIDVTGSLTVSLGARLGRMNLGLEAGSLLSRYHGRTMLDLMLGARARF